MLYAVSRHLGNVVQEALTTPQFGLGRGVTALDSETYLDELAMSTNGTAAQSASENSKEGCSSSTILH
jgi:hypothetical protein